jgi:hypothetical protein
MSATSQSSSDFSFHTGPTEAPALLSCFVHNLWFLFFLCFRVVLVRFAWHWPWISMTIPKGFQIFLMQTIDFFTLWAIKGMEIILRGQVFMTEGFLKMWETPRQTRQVSYPTQDTGRCALLGFSKALESTMNLFAPMLKEDKRRYSRCGVQF